MSDLVGLVFLITIGDTPASVDHLVGALRAIAETRRPRATDGLAAVLRSAGAAIAPGQQALTPREAHFARTRSVPLARAVGEVVAEPVIPYPPGVPVLIPGEVISAEKIAYLRLATGHGVHIQGPIDPTLATVRVVAKSTPANRPRREAMQLAESARTVSYR
jgi:lysine decarboxylase